MPHYDQVPLSQALLQSGLSDGTPDLPFDEPIAFINIRPEALAAETRIRFDESHDDLDAVKLAVLRLDGFAELTLLSHTGAPTQGTEVWVREPDTRRSRALLDALCVALSIDESLITWTADANWLAERRRLSLSTAKPRPTSREIDRRWRGEPQVMRVVGELARSLAHQFSVLLAMIDRLLGRTRTPP
jgi:hypothetical protein